MEFLSLLVVLAACWSTGNVAWTLIAGGRRTLGLAAPSLVSAGLTTGVIVFNALGGDSSSVGFQVVAWASLAVFVFSDLAPRWIRKQINMAVSAGALDRAVQIATSAQRLPHPLLRLEALQVRVLVELQRGDLEVALATQRDVIDELFGVRRLEAIANLLAVLATRQLWERFLAAYAEYGGPELLDEVPSLGTGVLQAQGSVGDLGGVCQTLEALEEGYARNGAAPIWELRALALALLGEPQAQAKVLERAGTHDDQALALRKLAAVRGGLVPTAETRGLPPELLVQPAFGAEDAGRKRALVERVLAASEVPPPTPPFPTHKPRWGEVPLTSGLLAALVAVFLASEGAGSSVDTWTLVSFGACVKWTALSSEPWRLLTATLLHAGLLHLLVNGYALHVLGRLAEPVFGSARLAGVYLLSGLGGSLASVGWGLTFDPTGSRGMVSVGASGAIMGLLGALLVAVLLLRARLPRGLRQRLLVGLTIPLALQVFMVIGVPNVDHAAHLGGLLAGGLSALLLQPLGRRPGKVWDRGWLVVLCVGYTMAGVLGSGFDAETFYDRLPRRVVEVPETSLRAEVPMPWRTPEELEEAGADPLLVDPLIRLQVGVLQGDPTAPESERLPEPQQLGEFLMEQVSGDQTVKRITVTVQPQRAADGWWEVELRLDALDPNVPGRSVEVSCLGALDQDRQLVVLGYVASRHRAIAARELTRFRHTLEPR